MTEFEVTEKLNNQNVYLRHIRLNISAGSVHVQTNDAIIMWRYRVVAQAVPTKNLTILQTTIPQVRQTGI